MNETDKMIEDVKNELLQMSNQARSLGIGLDNVAPGDKVKTNKTVEYLLTIAERLANIATSCEALLSSSHQQRKEL